ncbi:uncharacterized protein LOC106068712 [Biomphalaria glabrata]|uniref:Uncharacterized protein LOC106068712 n=1 Tax=Biomphalaria glabrata TaxID=6526 RepID=A0A9U8EDS9_BIOGL|nr:uncharacterized protein LOC106068712 [Biomphalaria glabrata]
MAHVKTVTSLCVLILLSAACRTYSVSNSCAQLYSGVFTNNHVEGTQMFLRCRIFLPCPHLNVSKVEAIEIYRSSGDHLAKMDSTRNVTIYPAGLAIKAVESGSVVSSALHMLGIHVRTSALKDDAQFGCAVTVINTEGEAVSLTSSSKLDMMTSFFALESILNYTRLTFFQSAPLRYRQHSYYYGYIMGASSHRAMQYCSTLDGYLAELDDKEEFDAIADFILTINIKVNVRVGGFYDNTENKWIFQHSAKPVTFFAWESEKPLAGGSCLALKRVQNITSASIFMSDVPCSGQFKATFLCEVDN